MLPRYGTPPNPPYKENLPEIRSLGRHPWELTLREFIEIVRRYYGIEIDPAAAAIAGGRFLSKVRRAFPVPVMTDDEIMSIFLLRSFCKLYRVPPEDFGLPAEEEED
ncbi:MAG TPA: hypothetical protein VGG03_25150 [Thermoanaerobaculia bacterium]|jgi:hypothetical protein